MQPIILTIETSTVPFSVVVSRGSEILSDISNENRTELASQLTLMIQSCCQEASIELSQLHGIAIAPGPGSYTGLRIGMAVAKGLCFALDIPLMLISGYEAMAQHVIFSCLNSEQDEIVICAALDARRDEVYMEVYDAQRVQLLPATSCVLPASLASLILRPVNTIYCVGDGAYKLPGLLGEGDIHYIVLPVMSSAAYLAPLALERYHKGKFDSVSDSEPFYLKPPNITTPKNRSL